MASRRFPDCLDCLDCLMQLIIERPGSREDFLLSSRTTRWSSQTSQVGGPTQSIGVMEWGLLPPFRIAN